MGHEVRAWSSILAKTPHPMRVMQGVYVRAPRNPEASRRGVSVRTGSEKPVPAKVEARAKLGRGEAH